MKGQVVLWKNSISYWEKFLHEVVHTLEQVAQTECGVFILGGAQNSTGQP